MKSYTDIMQSTKLAEILPIESADMFYNEEPDETYPKDIVDTKYPMVIRKEQKHYLEEYGIPCWSLAAIMELLPYDIKGHNLTIYKSYCPNKKLFAYDLSYEGDFVDYELSILVSTSSIELIDACVEMILKLKEKNLL